MIKATLVVAFFGVKKVSEKANNKPWFDYPEFHWNDKHVIIIGGGIAGCQMAWHFCQENWKVTLIERYNQLATEASGNVAGVISPKMTAQQSIGEDFYTHCFRYTLSQLQTLIQQGKTVDYDNCGLLQLTHNTREEKRWESLKKRKFSSDFLQLLDEDQTSRKAGITIPYKASYFPQAAWIEPASFCQALSSHPNCNIIFESEALSLKKDNNNWQVLNFDKKEIAKSEVIVICSGKDLINLEQTKFLPILPVAGQTTSATTNDKSHKLRTVIGHEGYLTPAINGQHIFGATFERNQSNPKITPEADIKNIQQLTKHLPEFSASLSQFKSSHVAVRMTSPDRFPYAGALPDSGFYEKNYHDLHQGKKYKNYPQGQYQKGLFILGGLGSRGLTTSGLCAKMLCDTIVNNPSNSSIELIKNKELQRYCHPARFIIKQLKTNRN